MDTSKLKPFVLEDALKGAPVVSTRGPKVRKLVDMETDDDYQLCVLFENASGFHAFDKAGISRTDSGHRLLMVPVEKTVWVNIYPSHLSYVSEAEADAEHQKYRLRGGGQDRMGGKAHSFTFTE